MHSSARAQAAATARAKKLDRARDDLDRLVRGLGSRHYPDPAAVTARVAAIARDRRVGAYLRTDHRHRPGHRQTHPGLVVRPGRDRRRGRHRRLVRPADQPARRPPTRPQVLRRYKGQEAVERRYAAFKGPLAVAPMFLHNNRRITALITVICLALLIFCLIERQVRRALAPDTHLDGLYAGHRPARPTGRLILAALAPLRLIPAGHGRPATIPQPRHQRSNATACTHR